MWIKERDSATLECDRCNKLPWSVAACKPRVWRYVVRGTCVLESRAQLFLRSANTRARCWQKGSPTLGLGKRWEEGAVDRGGVAEWSGLGIGGGGGGTGAGATMTEGVAEVKKQG
ncbi:unnamed protein product [Pleuronectes platessa]|uniref:Uncharacterized protein n=1 Tax=Pleuronectes platessa TaxID=8262 RepID=A0A9N7UNX3_PLEPL|nr:unnamed protein product [Pleuronectes platessa]